MPHYRHTWRSRLCMFIGLALGGILGVCCIVIGLLMLSHSLRIDPSMYENGNIRLNLSQFRRAIILLSLNIFILTPSLTSSKRAHKFMLKWKLAFEKDKQSGAMRLEYNSTLSLLKPSYDWWSANGLPANIIMALCKAVSYVSSSMIAFNTGNTGEGGTEDYNTVIPFIALLALGTSVLVQVGIAVWAISTTRILTWSASLLHITEALVNAGCVERVHGRCMHSLYDRYHVGPIPPRDRQMSVWDSSPQFRTLTMYVWMLVVACFFWFCIIWAMVKSGTQGTYPGNSWAIIPDRDTASMNFNWDGQLPASGILWTLGILVGLQGGIVTSGVACVSVLVNMLKDEKLWRNTSKMGDVGQPRRTGIHKMQITILLVEPFLHWLFGLAVSVDINSGFWVFPVQLLYVAILGSVGMTLLTYVGHHKPHSYQPSTYGHFQTLTNLIDEWHETMYWGHKTTPSVYEGNREIGHAGTSANKLKSVKLKLEYGSTHCDC
ncbi:hypothetical protein M0805_008406 [Coniferiporia weirii]|nr:hypothetical protein M0805_008406 [Coniferiporia weirii]